MKNRERELLFDQLDDICTGFNTGIKRNEVRSFWRLADIVKSLILRVSYLEEEVNKK